LTAPVLVMASGLHALPLSAVVGSYELVPPGRFLPVGDSTAVYVRAVSEAFGLALRLAAPFLVAGVLFQVVVGLAARLVPQLQVYFAAMPGQILGGLLLLGLIIVAVTAGWMEAARTMFAALPGL
jgi:flagellar biosynthetic protein FliR